MVPRGYGWESGSEPRTMLLLLQLIRTCCCWGCCRGGVHAAGS